MIAEELAIDQGLQIFADPEALRLLVAELLDDALSYCGADSAVVIRANLCVDRLAATW